MQRNVAIPAIHRRAENRCEVHRDRMATTAYRGGTVQLTMLR